jgi:hypothetical protein
VPPLSHDQGEEDTNGRGLDHGTERVVVVDAVALLETLGDETSLEALDASIRVVLDFEHPSTVNEVDARGCRDETPTDAATYSNLTWVPTKLDLEVEND